MQGKKTRANVVRGGGRGGGGGRRLKIVCVCTSCTRSVAQARVRKSDRKEEDTLLLGARPAHHLPPTPHLTRHTTVRQKTSFSNPAFPPLGWWRSVPPRNRHRPLPLPSINLSLRCSRRVRTPRAHRNLACACRARYLFVWRLEVRGREREKQSEGEGESAKPPKSPVSRAYARSLGCCGGRSDLPPSSPHHHGSSFICLASSWAIGLVCPSACLRPRRNASCAFT